MNAAVEILGEAQAAVHPRRERRIGSYDIAAIVGVSPFGGPIDVYERIVEGKKKEQTKAMRRGELLEPVIRQMYIDETGAKLTPLPEHGILYSEKYPFMACQIDDLGEVFGRRRIVDYKAPHPELRHKWGEPGTDDADPVAIIQAQWCMEAAGQTLADVVPYFGGDDLRIYPIHRDAEFAGYLVEAAAKFWRDHIIPKRPPPPDATASYGEWLERKFPISRGQVLEADFDAEAWAEQLFRAREQKEAAEELEQEARNHLEAVIGGADGLEGSAWRISWKSTKGRVSVDWEAIAREAGVPEELIQKHTKLGASYRTFRPSVKKPKKSKGAQ